MDVSSINRNQDYLKIYARNAEITKNTGYTSNEDNVYKLSLIHI